MFTPIKNFITYIQKNASGGTMFGSAGAAAAAATASSSDNGEQPAKESLETKTMEAKQLQANGMSEDSPNSSSASLIVPHDHVYDDVEEEDGEEEDIDDDIELQIKSSVMVRPTAIQLNGSSSSRLLHATTNDALPLKQIASAALQKQKPNWNAEYNQHNAGTATNRAAESDRAMLIYDRVTDPLDVSIEDFSSLSGSEAALQSVGDERSRHATPIDDELQDFANDPMAVTSTVRVISDDLCSLDSSRAEDRLGDEETLEEFITEGEDELDLDNDESYMKLADLRNLTDPDLILVNDSDLNSSIASDALSEDPLATDNETPTPLTGGAHDDASGGSVELLWHMKFNAAHDSSNTANTESDGGIDSAESTPQRHSSLKQPEKVKQEQPAEVDESSPKINSSASNAAEQQEELRSDGGSDSGLGSETSALLQSSLNSPKLTAEPTTATPGGTKSSSTSTASSSSGVDRTDSAVKDKKDKETAEEPSTKPVEVRKPLRSNLKRRLEVEDDSLDISSGGSNAVPKKPKRSINFDTVQVFYFPRQQGFGCVPSQGGCTLGMGAQHVSFKTLTLAEHAAELRRAHRLQLQENPRGSSSEDSEESEEDYLSEGSGSDLDAESNGFLQPMSPKQRRTLLKAAGVRKIDASEKVECRDIRNSREVCGCTCRDFCDPETCACSQAGIKCQVDRAMFPCGCSRDACGNTVGRVEFNPARVRTHFIHTLMRLEMENRQQQNPSAIAVASATSALCASGLYGASAVATNVSAIATTNYYNSLQPTQSNYSSGYASPAYMSEQQASASSAASVNAGSVYYQQSAGVSYAVDSTSAAMVAANTGQYGQMVDNLDGSLFGHTPAVSANLAPNYGEMLPSYSNNNAPATAAAASIAYHQHSLGYANASPAALYSAYHQTTLSATNYANAVGVASQFSSCAVPTIPPYGSATTTASSPETQYQNAAPCLALNTAAMSCISSTTSSSASNATIVAAASTSIENVHHTPSATAAMELSASGSGSSFISLNTPISSSSRLSQINELLQHNRNPTVPLVAVAKSPAQLGSFGVLSKDLTATVAKCDKLAASDSINTPPIMEQATATNSGQMFCSVAEMPAISTTTSFTQQQHSSKPQSLQMEPPP